MNQWNRIRKVNNSHQFTQPHPEQRNIYVVKLVAPFDTLLGTTEDVLVFLWTRGGSFEVKKLKSCLRRVQLSVKMGLKMFCL